MFPSLCLWKRQLFNYLGSKSQTSLNLPSLSQPTSITRQVLVTLAKQCLSHLLSPLYSQCHCSNPGHYHLLPQQFQQPPSHSPCSLHIFPLFSSSFTPAKIISLISMSYPASPSCSKMFLSSLLPIVWNSNTLTRHLKLSTTRFPPASLDLFHITIYSPVNWNYYPLISFCPCFCIYTHVSHPQYLKIIPSSLSFQILFL